MKVSVLSRCAEEKFVGDFTRETKVILHVDLAEYRLLAKILCKNIAFLYNIGLGDLVRTQLVKDVRTVRTILEKSEIEVKK